MESSSNSPSARTAGSNQASNNPSQAGSKRGKPQGEQSQPGGNRKAAATEVICGCNDRRRAVLGREQTNATERPPVVAHVKKWTLGIALTLAIFCAIPRGLFHDRTLDSHRSQEEVEDSFEEDAPSFFLKFSQDGNKSEHIAPTREQIFEKFAEMITACGGSCIVPEFGLGRNTKFGPYMAHTNEADIDLILQENGSTFIKDDVTGQTSMWSLSKVKIVDQERKFPLPHIGAL